MLLEKNTVSLDHFPGKQRCFDKYVWLFVECVDFLKKSEEDTRVQ